MIYHYLYYITKPNVRTYKLPGGHLSTHADQLSSIDQIVKG